MSAMRLARAATGRDAILKFAGAYHGHVDGLLAEAGSGLATQGIPASPGRPAAQAADTVVVPWNDRDAVVAAPRRELAAILAEPLPGEHGPRPARRGFLELLRERADETGALLVFDEVISGFRVARGGAQERTRGRARPDDPRQGDRRRAARRRLRGPRDADGADRAGRRRLPGRHALREPARDRGRPGDARAARRRRLRAARRHDGALAGWPAQARPGGVPVQVRRAPRPADASSSPRARPRLRRARGLRHRRATRASAARCSSAASTCPPSQFEAWFPSLAHTDEHVERTLEAAREASPRCERARGGAARRGGARCALRRRGAEHPGPPRRGREPPRPRCSCSRPSSRAICSTTARRALFDGMDADLRLLAGDALYALGLARLAELGDLPAVAELADLIALCARAHARGRRRRRAAWTGRGGRDGWRERRPLGAKQAPARRTEAAGRLARWLPVHSPAWPTPPMLTKPPRAASRRYTDGPLHPGAFEGETVTRRRLMAGGAGGRRHRERGDRPARRSASRSARCSRSTSPRAGRTSAPRTTSTRTTTSRRSSRSSPSVGEAGKTTVYVRKVNPKQRHGGQEQDRCPTSRSRPAAPTSAVRCARSRPSQRFVCPCHGGVYGFQGQVDGGPPVRPLDRFYTRVENGRVRSAPLLAQLRAAALPAPRDPSNHLDGLWQYLYPRGRRPHASSRVPKPHTPPAPRSRPQRRAMAATAAPTSTPPKPTAKDTAVEGVAGARRLARRAHRRHAVPARLPLPQGPEGHELVLHARLGDDVRLPLAGGHGRVPGDVLRAGPDARLRVGPAHHQRRLPRRVRARHAPLGRDRDDRPDLPAHGRGRSSSAPTSTRAS